MSAPDEPISRAPDDERKAPEGSPPSERFTPADSSWMVLACISVASVVFFYPLVGRHFAVMFREFGSMSLPWLTSLAISWWFPVLLGLAPLAALGQVLRRSMPLRARRLCAVSALVLALAGFAICLFGVYQPVFDLAGKIKAD